MKKSIIISALFAICSFFATAQTQQKGIIQEYNESAKKTALPGVEINVRSANSTVSDEEGNFALQFLTLSPGEKVNVRRIEKLGYEVFNKEAIEQWNINPKTPFIIIMCRSDRFKKIRDNYERVSSESYARQLKKDEAALVKLKADGKLKEADYQKQLYELRENYERQLDNIETYVDRFSRIDLSELSNTEQKIIELVQQGNIEEAIAKYEEQNFTDKYIDEVAQIKEISSAIDQLSNIKQSKQQSRDSLLAAIDRQIETLKLAGGKENFDKILTIYRDVASAGSMPIHFAHSYLKYLFNQNLYNEAISFGKEYISQNKECNDERYKVYNNIGNSYNQLSQYKQAIEFYDLAIKNITNEKGVSNLTKIDILINKGLAYSRLQNDAKASEVYDSILGQFVDISDEDDLLCKSRLIVNYTPTLRRLKKYEKADSILKDVLSLAISMDSTNAQKSLKLSQAIAHIYGSLGKSAYEEKKMTIARDYYSKAIKIYDRLYKYNPQAFCIDLSTFHSNYGLTYIRDNEVKTQAITPFEKSIALYNSYLKQQFNQRILDYYSQTAENLARLHIESGDTIRALDIIESSKLLIPTDSISRLKYSTLYSSIATMYSDLKQNLQAISYYKKSIAALEFNYELQPNIYRQTLARTYVNTALTQSKTYKDSTTIDYLNHGINLFEIEYQRDSKNIAFLNYAVDIAFTIAMTSKETTSALKYLSRLQEINPQNRKYFEYECYIVSSLKGKDAAIIAFNKLLQRFPDYPKDSKLYKALGPQ